MTDQPNDDITRLVDWQMSTAPPKHCQRCRAPLPGPRGAEPDTCPTCGAAITLTNPETRSPVSSIQATPENRSTDFPRPKNSVTCNGCEAWWTGLGAAHCGSCHETFTSVRAFDIHRRGSQCQHPGNILDRQGYRVLVPANRDWHGRSEPGTWKGPTE